MQYNLFDCFGTREHHFNLISHSPVILKPIGKASISPLELNIGFPFKFHLDLISWSYQPPVSQVVIRDVVQKEF